MKTTFKLILALAIGVVAMVFASCSNDDGNNPVVPSQQEIEAKIIGRWEKIRSDGKDVLTDTREVFTFISDGTGTNSMSSFKPNENRWVWTNKIGLNYSVIKNQICIKKEATLYFTVDKIYENQMFVTVDSVIANGVEVKDDIKLVFEKVTADYSQDIIGLWEGVEMTGYETYGNAEARIEYRADGTYTYYQKVDGYWVPSADADNEYNVDGDWLATRWRPEAETDYNYEWWDIDYIKGDEMKLSALREKEDGTRFTTTFTWKKVDDSASAQNIKANIVGSWQIDHVVRYEITDGNVIHKDIIPYDFMVSTISYTSDLTFSTYDYFVDSEQPDAKIDETRAQGRYSVADRQITHTFDDEPSKMYSNMVYSIDSQTMVIINHFIEGKTEFFSLTYYRKL